MAENQQYVTLGVAEEIFAAPVDQGPGNPRHASHRPPAAGTVQPAGHDRRARPGRAGDRPAPDPGHGAEADTENTRIVVLSVEGPDGERRLGLRTDRVFEVTVLDADELDPPPTISGTWSGHCIAGIGRRNGRFVTVLDLDAPAGRRERVRHAGCLIPFGASSRSCGQRRAAIGRSLLCPFPLAPPPPASTTKKTI